MPFSIIKQKLPVLSIFTASTGRSNTPSSSAVITVIFASIPRKIFSSGFSICTLAPTIGIPDEFGCAILLILDTVPSYSLPDTSIMAFCPTFKSSKSYFDA